jgi:DNA-binding PadR family transcriptional regulator
MRHPFEPDDRRGFGDPTRGLREHLHGHLRDHLHGHLQEHLHEHLQAHGDLPFPPEPGDLPGFPPRPGPAFRGAFPPGRPGFGPGMGFGFGRAGGGRGRGHGRGGHGPGRGRASRGNVRSAVLILLAERPMHGYEIIKEITERSHGWWRPSPGSVYPTLQLLADEDLVTTEQDSPTGKRLYALTETGRAEAEKQGSTPPWEQAADDVDANDVALREALSTLMAATLQLSSAGSTELRAKAAKILVDARRQLYLLLADAGTEQDGPAGDPVEDADPTNE